MNTLLPSARYFLEGMSQENLNQWFHGGITTYYDRKISQGDKANHLDCLHGVFTQMNLTLGNSQHRTTLSDEFMAIYGEFSEDLQGKFQLALGVSVRTILAQGGSVELIKDLIFLAVEIEYEGMADILAECLPNIDDAQLKKTIYIEAADFFDETRNHGSTSRLMQVCFDDPDVPQEIFLKLIMARVRMSTSGILDDLGGLDIDTVRSAYDVIKKYPHIVERFLKDLEDACKKAKIQIAEILEIIDPDTAN